MKKSTIWIIAIAMGACFLALLYLEASYLEDVVKMRKEQFDESVSRSLYVAARNMELDETQRGLEVALNSNPQKNGEVSENDSAALESLVTSTFELRTKITSPSKVAKGLIVRNNNDQERSIQKMREELRRRYVYHKALLNEVVYDILYKASDLPLAERVDFKKLDRYLESELRNNGINIAYHFIVTTSDGREVYRCPDYESKGEEYTYTQVLFANDPPAQTGNIRIHFPGMQKYIFSTVRFMVPAIFFTLILLMIFCFTVYTIFRQKRLTEIKNDFINNMTHEFKTPLSSISLAAQMLNDPNIPKDGPMFARMAGVINDETKRLRFQVEKILQMSMFERKGGVYKRKEVNADKLINGVVDTFRLKVESSGGKIEATLNAPDAIIFADEMHFTNVIFNLMDNAVKYKSEERELLLKVTTRVKGDRLIITVADNGIGIKKEDIKRVFDRFYRVSTGNRHDVKGFGLGLAYVKNVIDYHKGTIHAESVYGAGTKFIISLSVLK